MGTIMRLRSVVGWGKYYGKSVNWILENDPEYLKWCYFNLKAARLQKDVCDKLGLDSGIAFNKRKEYYHSKS
jgi:hypothetical protein